MRYLIAAAIIAAAAPAAAGPNLITNGTFADNDFRAQTGWAVSSSACFFNANGYHEAAQALGTLTQTFADAVGGVLTLTFDFGSTAGYQYVSFDGFTVPGSLVLGATGLTNYSFVLGAGTGSDTLVFKGQNDPSYNTLQNVSVTQTPEPGSLAILGLGAGVLGFAARRRQAA